MARINLSDLDKIQERVKGVLDINQGEYRAKVTVHMGTCGISAGASPVMEALKREIETKKFPGILLTSSGCPGLCSQEPMVTVQLKGREPVKYVYVDAEKAVIILNDHVINENIVEKYALSVGGEDEA